MSLAENSVKTDRAIVSFQKGKKKSLLQHLPTIKKYSITENYIRQTPTILYHLLITKAVPSAEDRHIQVCFGQLFCMGSTVYSQNTSVLPVLWEEFSFPPPEKRENLETTRHAGTTNRGSIHVMFYDWVKNRKRCSSPCHHSLSLFQQKVGYKCLVLYLKNENVLQYPVIFHIINIIINDNPKFKTLHKMAHLQLRKIS